MWARVGGADFRWCAQRAGGGSAARLGLHLGLQGLHLTSDAAATSYKAQNWGY